MNSLLTASEVASILKIHVNTVYYYLATEKLRGHKVIGNRWRIRGTDLESFVNGKPMGTEPEHEGASKKSNPEQVAGSVPTNQQEERR